MEMSKRVGRCDRQSCDGDDTGFDALQSTPEFCGPVEPLDGHESTEHLALVYEDRDEKFPAVVPFVRDGLARRAEP